MLICVNLLFFMAFNLIQKVIFSDFCMSAIHHNLSLSKCLKWKHSPPGNIKNDVFQGGIAALV